MATGGVDPYHRSGLGEHWPSPSGRSEADPYDGRQALGYTSSPVSQRRDRTAVLLVGIAAAVLQFLPLIAVSLWTVTGLAGAGVFPVGWLLVGLVAAGLSAAGGLVLWVIGLVRAEDRRPPLAWCGVIGMSLPHLLWLIGAYWWI